MPLTNKEKYNQYHKKYRLSTEKRRLKALEYSKKWKSNNKKQVATHQKKWTKANPEYFKKWFKANSEYFKKWRLNNKKKIALTRQKKD